MKPTPAGGVPADECDVYQQMMASLQVSGFIMFWTTGIEHRTNQSASWQEMNTVKHNLLLKLVTSRLEVIPIESYYNDIYKIFNE